MKLSRIIRIVVILLLVIVNVGCDQISKKIVREEVAYNDYIEIISTNFILTKVENTGAFLSLGSTLSPTLKNILLLGFPAIVLVIMLVTIIMSKKISWPISLGMAFIIGGGIGNLVDRMLYGSVTDFLHIDLGIAKTGIFNMADVSIMVGSGLILVFGMLIPHKQTAKTRK